MINYKDYLIQILDYVAFDDADWPFIQVNDDDGYVANARPASDGLADLLREIKELLEEDIADE
jgi:hypothetical protein